MKQKVKSERIKKIKNSMHKKTNVPLLVSHEDESSPEIKKNISQHKGKFTKKT